jgi:hypothetical protein
LFEDIPSLILTVATVAIGAYDKVTVTPNNPAACSGNRVWVPFVLSLCTSMILLPIRLRDSVSSPSLAQTLSRTMSGKADNLGIELDPIVRDSSDASGDEHGDICDSESHDIVGDWKTHENDCKLPGLPESESDGSRSVLRHDNHDNDNVSASRVLGRLRSRTDNDNM